jgi:hypothetical protein
MIWQNAGFRAVEKPGVSISPAEFKVDAERAFGHLRMLAETIGPRGSCTSGERAGAEYAAEQLDSLGLQSTALESFFGASSTYRRFALICAVAAAATLVALTLPTPFAQIFACFVHLAAAQAMLLESDFRSNWSRRIIPSKQSQNVTARLPSILAPIQTIVFIAHLDTARTPSFNASRRGQAVYSLLFRASLLSFLAAALLDLGFTLQFNLALSWGLAAVLALQLFMLGLFLSFEQAPYSPGAYDNASGVACVLALAKRLVNNPLRRSEIWFCLTGCEETGCGGAVDLFERHHSDWRNVQIINLDQVGYPRLYLRTREGLLHRYSASPDSISLASKIAADLSSVDFRLQPSRAFSDAAPAYQRGLPVFSFGTSPAKGTPPPHRHSLSDLPEHLSTEAFAENLCYLWGLVQRLEVNIQETSNG